MKIIVGLGNPGERHKRNRHNVGFMMIDELSKQFKDFLIKKSHSILSIILEYEIKGERVQLIKPLTYMNNSGESVSTLSRFYKVDLSNMCIVHDDLDLQLGEYKLQKNKGPKVHGGVASVEQHLKTTDFWRLRIGVDERDPEKRTPGDIYVLQDFLPEELDVLKTKFSDMCGLITSQFLSL